MIPSSFLCNMFRMKYFFVYFLTSIVLKVLTLEVKYLRGVNRLNNSNFTDYYFSCTGESNVEWEVSDACLVQFMANQTNRSVFISSSNYNCTAALLIQDNITVYTILIVSTRYGLVNKTLDIVCRDDTASDSASINKMSTIQDVLDTNQNYSVHLDFVLYSNTMISNTEMQFNVLMCGTNGTPLHWEVDGPPVYSFGNEDEIGKDMVFLSDDLTLTKELAIYISSEPYSLVSVLLVLGNNVTAKCSGIKRVELVIKPVNNAAAEITEASTQKNQATFNAAALILNTDKLTNVNPGGKS